MNGPSHALLGSSGVCPAQPTLPGVGPGCLCYIHCRYIVNVTKTSSQAYRLCWLSSCTCCVVLLQVLLQLNIAYYLPSIPVLLLFGQIEKLLDAEFGHTASMALRLMSGR